MIKTPVPDHKKIRSLTDHIDGPQILSRLLVLIDGFDALAEEIRGLILNYARWLDKTQQCKRGDICRKIKMELGEKINQRKISRRWIEKSLPSEYKRRYTACKVNSTSSSGNLLAIVDSQGLTAFADKESYELVQAVEKLLLNDSITNLNKPFGSIVHSLSMSLEEKVAMENQIRELSLEFYRLVDMISSSKKENQKKLFLAYRRILDLNIDTIDHRLTEL